MHQLGIIEKDNDKFYLLKRKIVEDDNGNGIFEISNLSAHRPNLLILKLGYKFKIITFSSKIDSFSNILDFLDLLNLNKKTKEIYFESVLNFVNFRKQQMKVKNKITDSEWLICN